MIVLLWLAGLLRGMQVARLEMAAQGGLEAESWQLYGESWWRAHDQHCTCTFGVRCGCSFADDVKSLTPDR
jgi:hypothetical protein